MNQKAWFAFTPFALHVYDVPLVNTAAPVKAMPIDVAAESVTVP